MSVRATAIVNETVITGTDVDQRVNLIIAANQLKLSPEDLGRLRLQVLRSLIDETLQIQQAKSNEIQVTKDEIDQSFARVSQQFGRSEAAMRTYLRSVGSSDRSLRRQIEADLAWNRFLRPSGGAVRQCRRRGGQGHPRSPQGRARAATNII